jgi:tetratricopeptide (TPR) repeat protein
MNGPANPGPADPAAGNLSPDLADVGRLLAQGAVEAAADRCCVLIETHPESGEVLRYLALARLRQNRIDEAEQCLDRALARSGPSADLLNDLGIAKMKRGAAEEAIDSFARALELDPVHADALGNLAAALVRLKQFDRAQPYLERLVAVQPFSGQAYARAANNSLATGDSRGGLRQARKAVRCAPQLREARLALASALETTGRFKQAKFQYLCVLRTRPQQPVALAKLLSLRDTAVDERHVRATEALLADPSTRTSDRAQLHLALARYHDQRGAYGSAFAQAARGNAILWQRTGFDVDRHAQLVDGILRSFTPELVRRLSRHAVQSARPIFIVGMPRSGTTLAEQILASHPAVAAGGELSTVAVLAHEIGRAGEPYPAGASRLDAASVAALGRRYLERLDAVSRDAAHVTDKMPFNFMHLGLIAGLFPRARIIHCRRDPLDTCLSCYFTSFSESLSFASDLRALGSYYLAYRRMMARWRAVLPPASLLEVDYERLVDHSEAVVREMLAHCGLPWEPACLEFHRTERGIRTPSRWQVRQPIYPHAVGRWRHYEAQLQPLREALAAAPAEPAT